MTIRSIFASLNISASGLSAQRQRIDTIARNLANVETTRTAAGGPYQREMVVVAEVQPQEKFRTIFQRVNSQMNLTHSNHLQSSFYSRQNSGTSGGVEVDEIAEDTTPPRMKYDPTHPDANADGYVALPNINVVTEMVDMMGASRAYEANLTVVDATKKIVKKSLEI
ncbi:flagellar basal body rod protein FlgC [candidate division KSB1 bacterium]|nr:flagellar basal body rod protein FlgC [candidate division KSB1 bacterium]